LEDTQVTWRELNDAFDRVYEEIDGLKVEMNQRFDRLEGRFDRLEGRFVELERKFDIVMRHITGQGD
jgi:predicted nuclease with TOPRIM domain